MSREPDSFLTVALVKYRTLARIIFNHHVRGHSESGLLQLLFQSYSILYSARQVSFRNQKFVKPSRYRTGYTISFVFITRSITISGELIRDSLIARTLLALLANFAPLQAVIYHSPRWSRCDMIWKNRRYLKQVKMCTACITLTGHGLLSAKLYS